MERHKSLSKQSVETSCTASTSPASQETNTAPKRHKSLSKQGVDAWICREIARLYNGGYYMPHEGIYAINDLAKKFGYTRETIKKKLEAMGLWRPPTPEEISARIRRSMLRNVGQIISYGGFKERKGRLGIHEEKEKEKENKPLKMSQNWAYRGKREREKLEKERSSEAYKIRKAQYEHDKLEWELEKKRILEANKK